MRKMLSTALVSTMLAYLVSTTPPALHAQRQVEPAVSLENVHRLLEKRGRRPLYLTAYATLARVRYVTGKQQLFLDIVALEQPGTSGFHELQANDPLVQIKMPEGFDAKFTITSCGPEFGKTACDQYSEIGQPLQVGNRITDEAKRKFNSYLLAISTVLKQ